ncbi:hypothetical protein LIER_42329 [Lithospermum erythrorhizon]|uniref:Uncharacterized protein n=1 Tax=Lithospermum erythrorhizon TaxID=34254 RepID=A0AAV3RMU9_LITER
MSKKSDYEFAALQLEFQKKSVDIELLEVKLFELEFEKVKVEDQCRLLRERNEELEEELKKIGNDKIVGSNGEKEKGHIVDLFGDEEDEVLQLMIENKVLECEKRKAESEVEEWKVKFMKLQSRVDELKKAFASEGQKYMSGGVKEIDQRLNEMMETNENGNGIQGVFSSSNLQVENLERKDEGRASVGAGNCCSVIMDKATKDVEEAGTPLARIPLEEAIYGDRQNRSTPLKYEIQDKFRVRKRLAFPQDESPTKKMAPSTPAGVRPADVDVIDIDDSDDEKKTTLDQSAPPTVLIGKSGQQSTHFGQDVLYEESKLSCRCGMISTGQCSNDCCEGTVSFKPTFRRKFSCNVVTSDTESDDDDDDVPLSRLTNNRNKEPLDPMLKSGIGNSDPGDEVCESAKSPCLKRLRKAKERKYPKKDSPGKNCTGRNYSTGIPTAMIVTDNDDEDGDSCHSEGDSLDGFIVNSSNLSDSEETSDSVEATQRDNSTSSENSRHSEDVSDGKLDYKEIISRIQRGGNHKEKWEFEADMLADFGKNCELCMRAVCALYRQQTSDERIAKGTFLVNGRGFNQCDALRGSQLAEFLTNGQGDLHKSVDELIKHDPKGTEKCRELACRYSKQLFEIYVNQEDPYFLPSQEGQS